jgi:hypothetical protein
MYIHALDVIEAVKDSEHIHTIDSGQADKLGHHIVGVGGVPDSVSASDEHLETHIGTGFPDFSQALPRAFIQKAHAHVKSGSFAKN